MSCGFVVWASGGRGRGLVCIRFGRRQQPLTKWTLAAHGRWVAAAANSSREPADAADQVAQSFGSHCASPKLQAQARSFPSIQSNQQQVQTQSFVSQRELLGSHPDSQRFASIQSHQRDRVKHSPEAAETFLKQQLQQRYQDEYIDDFVDGFISYLKLQFIVA